MTPIPCAPCCTTPQTVNIPGMPGDIGPQGDTGPAGTTLVAPIATYGVGAPQALTASFQMALGVAVTLGTAGTYMLWARLKADYSSATYGTAGPTLTCKLRRTSNPAGDLTLPNTAYAQTWMTGPKVTTAIQSLPPLIIPPFAYVTSTAGDQIQLWASISAIPDNSPTGNVNINEAEIVALQII